MSSWTKPAWLGSSGENARFGELYGRYYRSVHAYCRRRLANDAVDDAVSEVFLTAWRRLDDVPGGDAALLWLYGVAYRVIGNQWRSAARHRRLATRMRAIMDQPAPGADDTVLVSDACQLVLEAIARLSHTDVEVLLLTTWEHLSVAEIAAVLEIAPNAATQRLHRARRNLGQEYRRLQSQPPISEARTGGTR
jgi:RNA polymerase sigma-70 factor (ECF subfamily)